MADAYSSVSPDVKARQKALLETVATGGKRGLQSFEQAEKSLGELRKQALGRASSRAALVGGPEAQGFEEIADTQFSNRLADVGRARTTFEEDVARRGIAGQSAISQLNALVPLMRAKSEKAIAQKRESTLAGAKEKLTKDWEAKALGQAEMDEGVAGKNLSALEKELADLDAQTKQPKFTMEQNQKAIDDINKRREALTKEWRAADAKTNVEVGMHGRGLADKRRSKKEVEADLDRLARQRHTLIKANQRLSGDVADTDKQLEGRRADINKRLEEARGITPETRQERARRIAQEQLGIEPSLATGKIGESDVTAKLGKTDQSVAARAGVPVLALPGLRKDEDYQQYATALPALLDKGTTVEQFEQALRTDLRNEDGSFKTDIYRLLLEEFGDMFPGINESKRRTEFEEE